jgi:hypothetical protein
MARLKLSRPQLAQRWRTLRATLRLLNGSQPRAFVISAIASLAEPLFFPAFLLVLQRTLQQATASPTGELQATPALGRLGLALVALIIIQRLGIIVRDGSSTILRQEAWVVISKRILAKLPAVPYPLFENNAFQARYGLVIREAAHRSITLVDTLLSTAPIFFGMLALALTVLSLAPGLVLAMVVIAIPAALIEQRFSGAMYELQEHSAPDQLRMEALTNMQVDAAWQRDLRVYRSEILSREHASLAEKYLANLKRLTFQFVRLRSAAATVEALGIALALTAAYVLIGRGQLSLPNLAVLTPGLALLFGMIQAHLPRALADRVAQLCGHAV